MKPGKELNKLIAEKIMGHKVVTTVWGKEQQYSAMSIGEPHYDDYQGDLQLSNPVPAYSEDISAAWEVVEKLPFLITLTTNNPYHPTTPETEWYCSFQEEYEAEGSTAAHAICLAALRTVE